MEQIVEGIIVSTEAIVLAYLLRSYFNSKKSLSLLEVAPQLAINSKLQDIVEEAGGVVNYACLRGNVEALSPPIYSFNVPDVAGVIQRVTVREHVISQTRSGFWVGNKRLINSVMNAVPFAIRGGEDVKIEVVDPLSAKVLDLEVVADRFDVAPSSFLHTLWQFLTGVRKQGVQTMEELLKEGTLVTVVGEVTGSNNKESLSIMPPRSGAPFFVTTMPLRALMRKIEADISYSKWLSAGVGVVTAVTCTWLFYKYFKDWLRKEVDRKRLQTTRKERRRLVRDGEELSLDKLCVVCQTNPKEIILLPCGHVCLCEDCSDKIASTCPICKSTIRSRNAAYIA